MMEPSSRIQTAIETYHFVTSIINTIGLPATFIAQLIMISLLESYQPDYTPPDILQGLHVTFFTIGILMTTQAINAALSYSIATDPANKRKAGIDLLIAITMVIYVLLHSYFVHDSIVSGGGQLENGTCDLIWIVSLTSLIPNILWQFQVRNACNMI